MKRKNKFHFVILVFVLSCSIFVALSVLNIGTQAASFNHFVRNQLNQTPEGYTLKNVNISGIDKPFNSFMYSGQSNGVVTIEPSKTATLSLDLKNTGNTIWQKGTFHLGTSHQKDRESVFANSSWASTNRVSMLEDTVAPGEIAHFVFPITATAQSGISYEYFRPVIDGEAWLEDVGIYWKIIVKNPDEDVSVLKIYNKLSGIKKIVITISTQNLKCYEDGDMVCDFTISSGLPSMPTPTGNFKVERKRDVAYSSAYDLYMNYWMAFTPNESHGIHELPYWKYSWGIVTEGANHLGQKVSHGCVRLGIGSAKQVYDWAPVGTPVEIIN